MRYSLNPRQKPALFEGWQSGFSLLEIMIVIALIGLMSVMFVSNFLDKAEQAKIDLTRTALSNLGQTIRQYRMDNNRIPSADEGLNALIEKPEKAQNWKGPYTDEDKLNDAWNQALLYEPTDSKDFKLRSLGPDGEAQTEDDIVYPPIKRKSGEEKEP